MKIEGDDVIFSTGKVKYANGGIIGLNPSLEVSEGYDGGFYAEWHQDYGDDPLLTPAARVELADYMVEQWQRFKQQARMMREESNERRYCCSQFEEQTKILVRPGYGSNPAEFAFQLDEDGWQVFGCCGGNCYVITGMWYCPFRGRKLSDVALPAHS